jgi:hypothetical protein
MTKAELRMWRMSVWWARGQDFQIPKRYRPGYLQFVDLWYGNLIDGTYHSPS